ncbi:Na(+)-translocating NADH-quinone reductase subunit A [Ketobacter sp. MCCC 1A13808]|uniref:Na(+)-translocating NADH-quinone reductase subunit A n=1 Tax=Ketobacter sp. MCCC 1A13808 TaxID=2602738 RepID=UPI000F0F8BA8|nr:Na(+)-translocating NADH-quinone reductase subunit A [Ketobacter sp. MCCC 1A13808]MVF10723.1 Na(+)-translocating NADH-quinone reductase subunit A [Ketobacter sp. MCCC 1A13808]RLP56141.1 MAG: Na(+)-translocating NADH-quinone reductase subunit A [Ketobacter sp.]
MIKIKRGLNLPISGTPKQTIEDGPTIRTVAVLGSDYVGMKPTMSVKVGDEVKKGQVLFADKKTEGVLFTAPASGVVSAIHRGQKRVLQSVVIDVSGDAEETFDAFAPTELSNLSNDKVQENLIKSGLWTAFRARPFSKVPAPGSEPRSIFVTAIDTHPLAADPAVVIKEDAVAFQQGLDVLSNLTKKVWLCKAAGAGIGGNGIAEVVEFDGPHPAGLAGTHIHYLDPVSAKKTVWHINYQDVIAIGKLFTSGKLNTDRVVALCGPQVSNPRLVRTRLGASTDELLAGQLEPADNRVISGSVLGGTTAIGPYSYLGRYHNQITVLREGRERGMLEYLWMGKEKHSVLNTFISSLNPGKLFSFTTSTNGSPRAMVPVGAYEKVMPLDILPTQLLRSLIVGDTQTAQDLGCLELDEDDVALCSYVCPGKYEYGPILRDNLERIEKEG